jgi:TonB family protein
MVKAALISLALHGVLWLALRRAPPAPVPSPSATVELEVLRVTPRTAPDPGSVVTGGGGGQRLASVGRIRPSRELHSAVDRSQPVESPSQPVESPSQPVEPPSKPDLFARSALGHAAGVDVDAPGEAGFRPRQGVGSVDGRGGVAVGDFLAEDAGRERARKGLVPSFVRDLERKLDGYFDPPFAHVDNANRRELMHKQFMGFLKTPPKTGELKRGFDPTKETTEEKLRSTGDHAFFLGRRVLVFARQLANGTIAELSIRQPSGFHAFDEDALDAVEKALKGRPPRPEELRRGEVRTLWQLDATGYVVIAPEPTLKFDESTGKSEWVYPLQKRVDKAIKLLAVY